MVALATLTVLMVASGCQWSSYRFDAGLTGFNATESQISGATGASLVSRFRVERPFSTAVIVTSGMIIGKNAGSTLWGADASGTLGCTGTPTHCQPLWTAATSSADEWIAAQGSTVLASYQTAPNTTRRIAAYDAAGKTGCAGVPVVCTPLWTTDTTDISGATIANGLLYATDGAHLVVFDATGTQGCAGAPKVCSPLWSGPAFYSVGHPALAGGRVYVAYHQGYAVFDAAGTQGCTGSPKVCQPLWVADVGGLPGMISATSDYVVTVHSAAGGGGLRVTDAKGVVGCVAGTCHPLWRLSVPGLTGLPAIAGDRLFVQFGNVQSHADAYDLRGQTNCSGAALPLDCAPLWTHAQGVQVPITASTTAANDVVFFERYTGTSSEIPDGDLYVEALDQATGALRFATPASHGHQPPVVGDGHLYLSGNNGVEVFTLPS